LPVRSRAFIRDIAVFPDREGKEILTHKARAAMKPNVDVKREQEEFWEELKTIQFLVAVIWFKARPASLC